MSKKSSQTQDDFWGGHSTRKALLPLEAQRIWKVLNHVQTPHMLFLFQIILFILFYKPAEEVWASGKDAPPATVGVQLGTQGGPRTRWRIVEGS